MKISKISQFIAQGRGKNTKTIEKQTIAQNKCVCAENQQHADEEKGVERGKTLEMEQKQVKQLKTVEESQNTAHTSESSVRWEVVSKRTPRILKRRLFAEQEMAERGDQGLRGTITISRDKETSRSWRSYGYS